MTDNTLSPSQQKVHPPLGRNGNPLGSQPHRGPDPRPALPIPNADARRTDRGHPLRRAIQNVSNTLLPRARRLGHRPARFTYFGDRRDHFESLKDVWQMFEIIVGERKAPRSRPNRGNAARVSQRSPRQARRLHSRAHPRHAGLLRHHDWLLQGPRTPPQRRPLPRLTKLRGKVRKLLVLGGGSARHDRQAFLDSCCALWTSFIQRRAPLRHLTSMSALEGGWWRRPVSASVSGSG